MSEENVEVVRRGFAATLRGMAAALARWTPSGVRDFDIPDAGIYGHDGFREWLTRRELGGGQLEDFGFRPSGRDR